MELQKINIKLYFADSSGIQLKDFIKIFNSWIQSSDGVYYDLADYTHVNDGPGILLIAHEANVSVDDTEGRLGLLYNQKERLEGSNAEKLRFVFDAALGYCRKLEEEPSLKGKANFRGNEALVVINDRLIAPNTEETFSQLKADLHELARHLFGSDNFTLARRAEDPRRSFSVVIKTPAVLGVEALRNNLRNSPSLSGC